MNKDQLQKELQEKIKEGIKPSDLKKQKGINNSNSQTSQDEGYESDNDNSKPPLKPQKETIITTPDEYLKAKEEIKRLQEQVNFWSNTAQNYLKSLQRTTSELDQSEEKIRELQAKRESKNIPEKEKKEAVIDEIKKVVKPGDKPSDVKRKAIAFKDSIGLTQTKKLYNFACELCEQYRRQERRNFHRLDGLGLDPNKLYIICDTCIETGRANIVKERDTEYDPIKW